MTGLKIRDRTLRDILEIFGKRCLLILDGLDEHALSTNQDVLKIIRGEKLLSCSIIVTSRPHSTKQIEKYFPLILRIEGFTYNKAEQFASKIPKSVTDYLKFLQSSQSSLFLSPTCVKEIKEIVFRLPSKASSGHEIEIPRV